MHYRLALLSVVALLLAACSGDVEPTAAPATAVLGSEGPVIPTQPAAPPQETPMAPSEPIDVSTLPGDPVTGDLQSTPSGLQFVVVEEGTGPQPAAGSQVTVRYAGYLLDGTAFDSGEIPFALGTGAVIPGWDEGIAMMNVGGSRKLVIPPELGYGAAGFPGLIPANATLVFDVTLLSAE
jgi:peptidylprolyl isomerase